VAEERDSNPRWLITTAVSRQLERIGDRDCPVPVSEAPTLVPLVMWGDTAVEAAHAVGAARGTDSASGIGHPSGADGGEAAPPVVVVDKLPTGGRSSFCYV
jgi:hypothetical protein